MGTLWKSCGHELKVSDCHVCIVHTLRAENEALKQQIGNYENGQTVPYKELGQRLKEMKDWNKELLSSNERNAAVVALVPCLFADIDRRPHDGGCDVCNGEPKTRMKVALDALKNP